VRPREWEARRTLLGKRTEQLCRQRLHNSARMSQALHQLFSVVCSRSSPLFLLNNLASDEPIRGRHGRIDRACCGVSGLVDDMHDVSGSLIVETNKNDVCAVGWEP
jgi:hypothetical protein